MNNREYFYAVYRRTMLEGLQGTWTEHLNLLKRSPRFYEAQTNLYEMVINECIRAVETAKDEAHIYPAISELLNEMESSDKVVNSLLQDLDIWANALYCMVDVECDMAIEESKTTTIAA